MSVVSSNLPDRLPLVAEQAVPRPVSQPSEAAKPDLPVTAYFSPVVRIDPKTEQAVWEVRDPTTGQVVKQYPSEEKLRAYRVQSAAAAQETERKSAVAAEAGAHTAAAARRGTTIDVAIAPPAHAETAVHAAPRSKR